MVIGYIIALLEIFIKSIVLSKSRDFFLLLRFLCSLEHILLYLLILKNTLKIGLTETINRNLVLN